MSKARKEKPGYARQPKFFTMSDEQVDEMIQTAHAFGGEATHLRDLEASPDNPAGYGIFKAVCVNAGYAMELLLKVRCHMHNGKFKGTHRLTELFDSLPESVRADMEQVFLGNLERFGVMIQLMPFEVSFEGQQILRVPLSFRGYFEEFDRVGMTSQRYPTTPNPGGKPMPNHIHQAIIGVLTLNAAVYHYANGP